MGVSRQRWGVNGILKGFITTFGFNIVNKILAWWNVRQWNVRQQKL